MAIRPFLGHNAQLPLEPPLSDFARTLVRWQKSHGRHDLPWQGTRDPYRIWLSEIMLQQTQVGTVIPYYERFLARFPTLAALAAASEQEVLALWSGLGYYARGRNLLRAARLVMESHDGVFPRDPEAIARLPGVGRSTAAAIAAFAFGARAAILDGNVKRVLTRAFGIEGFPGDKAVEARLWRLAESLLPEKDVAAYTQGLMDLGATLCTRSRPGCPPCPLAASCVARREGRTAELPSPRPRRPRPQRQATVLVLHRDGRVLLEPRPAPGIWGGLLGLPELPEGEAPAAFARRAYGCQVTAVQELKSLRHGFTHFELELRPLLCQVANAAPALHEGGPVWLQVSEHGSAPLPAPVRKLLQDLDVQASPAPAVRLS